MKKYSRDDQAVMAAWSLQCADRVLDLFERARPGDDRPRAALEAGRAWLATGDFSMDTIRRASLGAHAAAKDVADEPAACAAAHAAGQAVATAHVAQHAYGGAYYALRAVAAAATGSPVEAALAEREWQAQQLPARLRAEIIDRIVVRERGGNAVVTVVKGPGF